MQTSSNNKWYLMICELHNPVIHGKTNTSDPNIETHYVIYNRYNPVTKFPLDYDDNDDNYNNCNYNYNNIDNSSIDDFSTMYEDISRLKSIYLNPSRYERSYSPNHPTIRHYSSIVTKRNYIKPEIGLCIILPTQEAVAILKTFWFRIISKKWKKVFQERKRIIQLRCNRFDLTIKQMRRMFPKSFVDLPGLKGMLSDLK
jgi:hypothetical protein